MLRIMYRKRPAIAAVLTLLFLLVLFLRHDYWNWDTPGYLLFGFLPRNRLHRSRANLFEAPLGLS